MVSRGLNGQFSIARLGYEDCPARQIVVLGCKDVDDESSALRFVDGRLMRLARLLSLNLAPEAPSHSRSVGRAPHAQLFSANTTPSGHMFPWEHAFPREPTIRSRVAYRASVYLPGGAHGDDERRSVVGTMARVDALRECGYTERDTQFLELAALHSGYFVRRQFNAFIGRARGGSAAALLNPPPGARAR